MSKFLHQCSGCRQRKVLVVHTCGMGYCENCKHKAPTKEEFKAFRDHHLTSSGNYRDRKVKDKFMRAVISDR